MTESDMTLPPITAARTGFVRYLQIFRGLWMFTWKDQVNWKKLVRNLPTFIILPSLIWFTLDPGNEKAFRQWVIQFYFFMILPLVCLAQMGSIMREEIQNDTMPFLMSRPIRRAEFYLFKYMAFALWLQILLGLELAGILGVGFLLELPNLKPMAVTLFTTQILAIVGWGSISAMLGLISQKFMVIGIVYGAIVEFGIGLIPTNINNLSFTRHFQTLLAQHAQLALEYNWSPEKPLFSGGAVILGTLITLLVGALLFHFKEFHANEGMKK